MRTIYLSSLFNKLKINQRYLNHKVNRRCDDLIEVLLSVEKDMFFERKRKETVTSISDASKKQEGDRHNRGLDIDNSRISNPVSIDNLYFIMMLVLFLREIKSITTRFCLVMQKHNIK